MAKKAENLTPGMIAELMKIGIECGPLDASDIEKILPKNGIFTEQEWLVITGRSSSSQNFILDIFFAFFYRKLFIEKAREMALPSGCTRIEVALALENFSEYPTENKSSNNDG